MSEVLDMYGDPVLLMDFEHNCKYAHKEEAALDFPAHYTCYRLGPNSTMCDARRYNHCKYKYVIQGELDFG